MQLRVRVLLQDIPGWRYGYADIERQCVILEGKAYKPREIARVRYAPLRDEALEDATQEDVRFVAIMLAAVAGMDPKLLHTLVWDGMPKRQLLCRADVISLEEWKESQAPMRGRLALGAASPEEDGCTDWDAQAVAFGD